MVRALSIAVFITLFSLCARAEQVSSASVNLAEIYGKAALVGMQLTIQKKASEGKFSSDIAACVSELPSTTFNAVFDTALNTNLNEAERTAAVAFFGSSAGQKYTKTGILQIYKSLGMDTPEPMPEFSANEYTELAKFTHTPAGEKLIMKRILEVGATHQDVGSRVQELLHSCNDKLAKR